MTRLESLCYAIQVAEGWAQGSRSWRNNNPGNLRSSPLTDQRADDFAVFHSYAAGWRGLWLDLWLKCSGRSKSGVTPETSLREFAKIYAAPPDEDSLTGYVSLISGFTGATDETPMSWFLENE